LQDQVGWVAVGARGSVGSAVDIVIVAVMIALVVAAEINGDGAGRIPSGSGAVFLEEAVIVGLLLNRRDANPSNRNQAAVCCQIAVPFGQIHTGVKHPIGHSIVS